MFWTFYPSSSPAAFFEPAAAACAAAAEFRAACLRGVGSMFVLHGPGFELEPAATRAAFTAAAERCTSTVDREACVEGVARGVANRFSVLGGTEERYVAQVCAALRPDWSAPCTGVAAGVFRGQVG